MIACLFVFDRLRHGPKKISPQACKEKRDCKTLLVKKESSGEQEGSSEGEVCVQEISREEEGLQQKAYPQEGRRLSIGREP